MMAEGSAGKAADPISSIPCVKCDAPAKLQCPKCLEMRLPRDVSAYCSQACFKADWPGHKVHHRVQLPAEPGAKLDLAQAALAKGWLYATKKGAARTDQCPTFAWTGDLRPLPISPRRRVPTSIPRPEWAETGYPEQEIESRQQRTVEIRTPKQIAGIRAACKLGREVLDAAAAAIRPGITTDEIDRIVHEATIAGGAYPSPLNYHNFPKSTCTSVNEVICHGIPDARPLAEGDIVNVDVSVFLNGYHGDLNETFFVGKVDDVSRRLVQTTYECMQKAIEIVKPGVLYREVGEVISRHASMNTFQVVKSYCGHGIGDLFHCAPNIPHYARNKAVGVMKAGQTFTIEPMINTGVWRDRMWPDGWTAVTEDGGRSAQFEHTLLVTETGVEVLTARFPTSPKVFPWLHE
ncbi:methionine aminopeptidase 1 [Klebsormidium nitens]|uniref:Methionine aminopeptidase n=1 Tax=Klebsormidium nitens TaxID=105231 RepID=A0A1Y1I0C7_KLENI|nr:methionine aminopeptidase 1 [Klebsormidium nitens]|eukprot:GAQ84390.1 methionine aminopeptidase 1 [Klebsormidium nitens]